MDSLRPAICLWQSMSREITQRFSLPSHKMYPCSVAEKRARRWCHQRIENSGNRFDYHSVKTKPNLDDRQDFNGTSINKKTVGALPLVQVEKEQKQKKNLLWKKSNHTAYVKWGILLFWFRVLAHFVILIFPSLKLRIEKSKLAQRITSGESSVHWGNIWSSSLTIHVHFPDSRELALLHSQLIFSDHHPTRPAAYKHLTLFVQSNLFFFKPTGLK